MATITVTGCNRGIGYQLCKQLAARGDEVIGVCRTSNPELDALGIRVVDSVDAGRVVVRVNDDETQAGEAGVAALSSVPGAQQARDPDLVQDHRNPTERHEDGSEHGGGDGQAGRSRNPPSLYGYRRAD